MPTFADSPILGEGTYQYSNVEVRDIPLIGVGVFASSRIKKGFTLPYGGILLSEKEAITASKNPRRNRRNSYTCSSRDHYNDDPESDFHLWDAHPSHLASLQADNGEPNRVHGWVGALLNEPREGEPNCELRQYNSMPAKYPHTNSPIFVVALRRIEEGEELTLDYGYSDAIRRNHGIISTIPPRNSPKYKPVTRRISSRLASFKNVEKARAAKKAKINNRESSRQRMLTNNPKSK